MARPKRSLRTQLRDALEQLADGHLLGSATDLFKGLGYASHKTLALPTQPAAFAKEVEALLGGSKQLNTTHASLSDWKSADFFSN